MLLVQELGRVLEQGLGVELVWELVRQCWLRRCLRERPSFYRFR